MSMKDTLKKAKIAAMKAKDKAKLNPINLTLADIQNLEIANGHEATDEEVLKVIQKGVKTRRETAKLYEDKGLADKAAPETAGTLRTDNLLFGGMLLGCVLIVGALLFMPVAVLGPIAEHLSAVR